MVESLSSGRGVTALSARNVDCHCMTLHHQHQNSGEDECKDDESLVETGVPASFWGDGMEVVLDMDLEADMDREAVARSLTGLFILTYRE